LLVRAISLTAKVALLDPAGTVAEAGNVRTLGIAPEMAIEAPLVGAALVKVTVQVVEALEARVVAAHCREETAIGATSEMFTGAEDPLREAVTVAA
jgi:hypothetical protein